jgi:hypothetical protein
VFYEEGQHCLQFCLSHLSCVKMVAFQFFLQSRKQKKVAGGQVRWVDWVGDDTCVVSGQKFPNENKMWNSAVLWCNSQFFCRQNLGWSLHTFSCSRCKHHNSMRHYCLASHNELFVNNPFNVKENDEHTLDFAFHLSCLFQSRWVWTFQLGGLLFCLRVITINPALVTSDNLEK